MKISSKLLAVAAAVALGSSPARAEILAPLHIYVSQPLTDEFGQVLEGSALVPGALVQVYLSLDGGMAAPGEEGEAQANHELIYTSAIGHAQPEDDPQPGRFFLSLPRSLEAHYNGATLFVRVFNTSALETASFYGDSAPFVVSLSVSFVEAVLSRIDQPFRLSDGDGDGLVLSWEMSYGSSDGLSDSDGNGMSDNDEHLAGTDPTDPDSILKLSRIEPQGSDATLRWASVPGRRYQVEALSGEGGAYAPLGPVVEAVAEESALTLPGALLEGLSFFRVAVLVEETP